LTTCKTYVHLPTVELIRGGEMNIFGLGGTVAALCLAAPALSLTVYDVLPEHGNSHRVTVTFNDPETDYFSMFIEIRSVFAEYTLDWEEQWHSDWEGEMAYISVHDGVLDWFDYGYTPTWPYDSPSYSFISDAKMDGTTLSFIASMPPNYIEELAPCDFMPDETCRKVQYYDLDGGFWGSSASASSGATIKITSLSESPAVPEPATWSLMIAGFGIAGAAARRRRQRIA
jgi:hypothetical protein